ncbi:Antitoxin VapB25 [Microbacterium sp. SA39]|nr:Antitoxin VapB25 [Microbacterium sp. SA39]
MLVCVRTTLNLSEALAAQAKIRAAAEGRTLTSFIEEALRDRLAKSEAMAPAAPLPTFGDPSTSHFLVDIDDRDALWEALDEVPSR